MNRNHVTPFAASGAISLFVLLASTEVSPGSTSLNYRIDPLAFGAGGGIVDSADYDAFVLLAGTTVGTATSANYTARYGFLPSAGPTDVTGRFVFYNQSAWDGNVAAANANDDNAIAPDKKALLPGETATFANYTSYSRGLNGVMVDLPLEGTPTAADFAFKRGNNSTPAGWAAAPAPTTIAVRAGAGAGGADRVTLIWPNNTIQKQWLEVTVLSTAHTGLADSDVFYFGNAIGESGNNAANAQVTTADALQAQAALAAFAPLDNRFDFNRDGRVASADPLIAQSSLSALNPLLLINLGGGGDLARPSSPPVHDQQVAPGGFSSEHLAVQMTRLPGATVLTLRHYVGPEAEATLFTTDNLSDPRWLPVGAGVARARADGWVDWTVEIDPQRPHAYFMVVLTNDVRTQSSNHP